MNEEQLTSILKDAAKDRIYSMAYTIVQILKQQQKEIDKLKQELSTKQTKSRRLK